MSMMPRTNRSIWLPSREVQIRATQSPAGVLSARRRDLGPEDLGLMREVPV